MASKDRISKAGKRTARRSFRQDSAPSGRRPESTGGSAILIDSGEIHREFGPDLGRERKSDVRRMRAQRTVNRCPDPALSTPRDDSRSTARRADRANVKNQRNIDILGLTYLGGPSMWTYPPVIEALVDIGELEDFPSDKLPGFPERLSSWIPTLIEHRCSYGERGGFLRRESSGGEGRSQGREREAPNGRYHPLAAACTAALSLS